MAKTREDEIRLAIVQHGDYREAFQTYVTDEPESYAGMKSSVKAIEQLIADKSFLLISLDAPAYRWKHGDGTLLSLPVRQLPRIVPRRIADAMRRSQVLKELRLFAPTHVLLRTSGRLAIDIEGMQHQVLMPPQDERALLHEELSIGGKDSA